MSVTNRPRRGCLPALLLAGFLVLMLGSGAAWAGSRGGHGGHGGGSGGGRIEGVPFGDFGNFRFATGGHRVDRRRGDGVGFGPLWDAPYYDTYVEPDDARAPRAAAAAGPSHSGYCDVSGSYPQNCVWKDGP